MMLFVARNSRWEKVGNGDTLDELMGLVCQAFEQEGKPCKQFAITCCEGYLHWIGLVLSTEEDHKFNITWTEIMEPYKIEQPTLH